MILNDMTLHTERLYSTRTATAIRVVLAVLVYLSALFVYPTTCIVLGFICLVWYGGYEIIGAALILDALLAPGGGVLGDFHYTVLFLVAAAATMRIRSMFFTAHNP
jgi:hypothetical protein